MRIDKFTYMYCWFGNNVDMEGNQEENSQTKKLERINFRVFWLRLNCLDRMDSNKASFVIAVSNFR